MRRRCAPPARPDSRRSSSLTTTQRPGNWCPEKVPHSRVGTTRRWRSQRRCPTRSASPRRLWPTTRSVAPTRRRATATSGDTVQVTTKNASICSAINGVVTFVSNGSCVVYFNDPGNVNYESALTQSQTMTVGLQTNAITITSSAPGSAQVGQNYSPSASAISEIPSPLPRMPARRPFARRLSNTVYFVGTGTCQVDFNDPGNSQYQAAPQKTQSFTVTVGPPAGYSIWLNRPRPTVYRTTATS